MNTLTSVLESPETVQENDLKVLEIIARSSIVSQRGLAQHSGLSLGMVNLVLKRLVTTGYIQIQNLERHKMRYFLTAQGLAAKYRRAHEYLNRTIRIYELYRQGISKIIHDQIAQGHNKFAIYGEGDIVELVGLVLEEKNGTVSYRVCSSTEPVSPHPDEIPLICYLPDKAPIFGISVLEMILNTPSAHLSQTR